MEIRLLAASGTGTLPDRRMVTSLRAPGLQGSETRRERRREFTQDLQDWVGGVEVGQYDAVQDAVLDVDLQGHLRRILRQQG
eukprot:758814-Hanusia_phi.AAC.7